MFQKGTEGLLRRGVWQAPWFGPDGEMVLVAIDRNHKLILPPVIVPHGAGRIQAGDDLLAELDLADPIPDLRIV